MTQHILNQDALLLDCFTEAGREDLLRRARVRFLAAGEPLFYAGDIGDEMYIIQDGRIEISTQSLSGRRSVLNHMGPGEIVGEVALLDQGTRSADAVAATDVKLAVITRSMLTIFLRENADVAMALIAALCGKVRNASSMFEIQSQASARARLARCILQIAGKWGADEGDHVRITQDLTHADIGAFAGLARENVSRHFKAMAQDGLIRMDGQTIVLLDKSALENLAEI